MVTTDAVCIEVNSSAKRRMPQALQERLNSRQYRRNELDAEKVMTRLQAAEDRRKGRLEKVKQKAIDTRPVIYSWGACSSSSILEATIGTRSEEGFGTTTESPTTTPPIDILSTNTSFNPMELEGGIVCGSDTNDYWSLLHAINPLEWETPLTEASPSQLTIPLTRETTTAVIDGDVASLSHVNLSIENFCKKSNGKCTVRLTCQSQTRSNYGPLDKPFFMSTLSELISADMGRSHSHNVNAEAVAILKAKQRSSAVLSGSEALRDIIRYSSSNATVVKNALNVHEGNGLAIIVSSHHPSIQPETEWRCFINNREVTAISQYHNCYFSGLSNPRLQILQFLLPLLSHLPSDSCVVDICIPSDSEVDPLLLAIHPFHISTDGLLFNWSNPSDMEILTCGFAEIRMKTEPLQTEVDAPPSWKEVIDEWWESNSP